MTWCRHFWRLAFSRALSFLECHMDHQDSIPRWPQLFPIVRSVDRGMGISLNSQLVIVWGQSPIGLSHCRDEYCAHHWRVCAYHVPLLLLLSDCLTPQMFYSPYLNHQPLIMRLSRTIVSITRTKITSVSPENSSISRNYQKLESSTTRTVSFANSLCCKFMSHSN